MRLRLQIICNTPQGQGLAQKLIVDPITPVANATGTFDYYAPSLFSLTPALGSTAGGTTLLISGQFFGLSGTIDIDGINCPLVGSWSQTTLQVSAISHSSPVPSMLILAGTPAVHGSRRRGSGQAADGALGRAGQQHAPVRLQPAHAEHRLPDHGRHGWRRQHHADR